MTKILAFDTATAACSAALYLEGECAELLEIAPRRHGERLVPMIDSLLKKASLSLSDCDAIAVGNGPGSFMGLRIAAGVAQGLAYGAGIPVIPISTLQALAQTAYWQMHCDSVLVGWDARMDQIYWGAYQLNGELMQAMMPDQLTNPTEVRADQVNAKAGNAWAQYNKSLPEAIRNLPEPEAESYPRARAVAFLAADRLARGGVIAPDQLELSYLRNQVATKPTP